MELFIPVFVLSLLVVSFLFLLFVKYVLTPHCCNCHSTDLLYFKLPGGRRIFCKTCKYYRYFSEANE